MSFMDHIPDRYQGVLREAIDAVTETKILLDQVEGRFGTKEPAMLRERMGQEFDGVTVTEAAVEELQALLALHEDRRVYCQQLMEQAARGEPLETSKDQVAHAQNQVPAKTDEV